MDHLGPTACQSAHFHHRRHALPIQLIGIGPAVLRPRVHTTRNGPKCWRRLSQQASSRLAPH
jgi:hypothetical protein